MLDVFVSTFPWFWSTSLPEGNVARHPIDSPHGNLLAQEWRRRREAPATALRADLSQRVTPNHLMFNGIFGCKPTILVYLHVWKPPTNGASNVVFFVIFRQMCLWNRCCSSSRRLEAEVGPLRKLPGHGGNQQPGIWNAQESASALQKKHGGCWLEKDGRMTNCASLWRLFLVWFVVSTFCSFKRSTVRLW